LQWKRWNWVAEKFYMNHDWEKLVKEKRRAVVRRFEGNRDLYWAVLTGDFFTCRHCKCIRMQYTCVKTAACFPGPERNYTIYVREHDTKLESNPPECKPIDELAFPRDECAAMELANLYGRPVTVDEVVKRRRETVNQYRQICKGLGLDLSNYSDRAVWVLMMQAQKRQSNTGK